MPTSFPFFSGGRRRRRRRRKEKSEIERDIELPASSSSPFLLPPDIERYRGKGKSQDFPNEFEIEGALASQKTRMCWTTRDGPDTFRAKCAPLLATLNAFPRETNEREKIIVISTGLWMGVHAVRYRWHTSERGSWNKFSYFC